MKLDWNAIAKVGVPGAIALYLVWNLTTGFDKFDSRLAAMEVQHAHAAEASAVAKDIAGRGLMTNEKILWILKVMCVNDAQTKEARELCLAERVER